MDSPDADQLVQRIEMLEQVFTMQQDRIEALEREVELLKQQPATVPASEQPEKQDHRPLPSDSKKLHIQLFENFRNAKRPKTQPLVQAKVSVWGATKLPSFWLVPLHRPDRAQGRRYLGALMPTIETMGKDSVCYAGQAGGLQIYIDHQHGLHVRWRGNMFQADPPSSKPSDAAENAPTFQWYCNLEAC